MTDSVEEMLARVMGDHEERSVERYLHDKRQDSSLKKKGGGGIDRDRPPDHHQQQQGDGSSMYDDEDGSIEGEAERRLIFGDAFDEDEEAEEEGEDVMSNSENGSDADDVDGDGGGGSMIGTTSASRWGAFNAAAARQINQKGKEDADNASELSDEDMDDEMDDEQGTRASNLQVVGSNGQPMGSYTPMQSLTLEEAYNEKNPLPSVPGNRGSSSSSSSNKAKAYGMPVPKSGSSSSKKRGRDNASEGRRAESDAIELKCLTLLRECNVEQTPEFVNKLRQHASGHSTRRDVRQSGEESSDGSLGGSKRRRVGEAADLSTSDDEERYEVYGREDMDYVSRQFATMLEDAQVSLEQMRELLCPLCGCSNIIDEEPVSAKTFKEIEKIAEVGTMFIGPETLAFIIAEMWNVNIYRRMKAANKRIMPFTYKMAYEHLKKPHRPDPRPDHKNDIETLSTIANTMKQMIFYRDPVTQRLRYDKAAFSMTMTAIRNKNSLRRTLPEKMAYFNPRLDHPTAAASGLVNPFKTVQYEYGSGGNGKRKQHAGSLGGRQTNGKK